MKNKSTGRKRDSVKTKEIIIAAAQSAFAEHGYSQAGVREIAEQAGGISSSLIVRYFGSKMGLFEAALLDAIQLNPVLVWEKSEFGQRLARLLLDGGSNIQLTEMIVLSTGNAEAREISARVAKDHMIERLGKWLGPPNARARAMNLIMLGTGFILFSRQLPVGPLHRESVKWFAETIQSIVDGSDE